MHRLNALNLKVLTKFGRTHTSSLDLMYSDFK